MRFLAVLELYKQGVIDLEQAGSFADLVVLPLAPGERVELDLLSIADLDGEPIVLAADDDESDDADDAPDDVTSRRVEEHA